MDELDKKLKRLQQQQGKDDMRMGYSCLLIILGFILFVSICIVLPVCITICYIFGK